MIPARTAAGLQLPALNNVPPGATCTVTEAADGATSIVTATVLPRSTQTVTVPAGRTVVVPFINISTDSPGTLVVSKTISGAAAGKQGPIAILVDCGQPLNQYAFTIPANTAAGTVSRSFPNLPAGLTCTITETTTGATDTVSVQVTGGGQKVTIAPAKTATAVITDSYAPIGAPATTQAASSAATTLETLAVTGPRAGPVHLFDFSVALMLLGGVLVTVGGSRRHRRRHATRSPAKR